MSRFSLPLEGEGRGEGAARDQASWPYAPAGYWPQALTPRGATAAR
jgi:hypothetical protein